LDDFSEAYSARDEEALILYYKKSNSTQTGMDTTGNPRIMFIKKLLDFWAFDKELIEIIDQHNINNHKNNKTKETRITEIENSTNSNNKLSFALFLFCFSADLCLYKNNKNKP
jgi:HD-like signal output (HDOD) protein